MCLLGLMHHVLLQTASSGRSPNLLLKGVEQRVLDAGEAGDGVGVRAAQGLGDDLVHHPKLDQLRGGDAQRLGGLRTRGAH